MFPDPPCLTSLSKFGNVSKRGEGVFSIRFRDTGISQTRVLETLCPKVGHAPCGALVLQHSAVLTWLSNLGVALFNSKGHRDAGS